MRKYVIMGIQGSGKGTQAKMLAADLWACTCGPTRSSVRRASQDEQATSSTEVQQPTSIRFRRPPAPVTSTGHTAGSACVGSQQLGDRSGRGQINGAMQWEALRKARWSAMRPGHLLAHTRRGHAAFVLMRLRSVRLRSGLRTRQMATRPRRHRCRGRSTSPAAGARLPGRTGHRLRSGTPWPVMLTGRMAPARPHPRGTAGDQRGARPSRRPSRPGRNSCWIGCSSHAARRRWPR